MGKKREADDNNLEQIDSDSDSIIEVPYVKTPPPLIVISEDEELPTTSNAQKNKPKKTKSAKDNGPSSKNKSTKGQDDLTSTPSSKNKSKTKSKTSNNSNKKKGRQNVESISLINQIGSVDGSPNSSNLQLLGSSVNQTENETENEPCLIRIAKDIFYPSDSALHDSSFTSENTQNSAKNSSKTAKEKGKTSAKGKRSQASLVKEQMSLFLQGINIPPTPGKTTKTTKKATKRPNSVPVGSNPEETVLISHETSKEKPSKKPRKTRTPTPKKTKKVPAPSTSISDENDLIFNKTQQNSAQNTSLATPQKSPSKNPHSSKRTNEELYNPHGPHKKRAKTYAENEACESFIIDKNPNPILVQSFPIHWNIEMKEFYGTPKNPDFKLRDVMQHQRDDKKYWKTDSESMSRNTNRVRCKKCRQMDHYAENCPQKSKSCFICGLKGHHHNKCSSAICLRCGSRSDIIRNGCNFCFKKKFRCSICSCVGHEEQLCPDLWRRYNSITFDFESASRRLSKLEGKISESNEELNYLQSLESHKSSADGEVTGLNEDDLLKRENIKKKLGEYELEKNELMSKIRAEAVKHNYAASDESSNSIRNNGFKYKPRYELYCSNCAKKGHCSYFCTNKERKKRGVVVGESKPFVVHELPPFDFNRENNIRDENNLDFDKNRERTVTINSELNIEVQVQQSSLPKNTRPVVEKQATQSTSKNSSQFNQDKETNSSDNRAKNKEKEQELSTVSSSSSSTSIIDINSDESSENTAKNNPSVSKKTGENLNETPKSATSSKKTAENSNETAKSATSKKTVENSNETAKSATSSKKTGENSTETAKSATSSKKTVENSTETAKSATSSKKTVENSTEIAKSATFSTSTSSSLNNDSISNVNVPKITKICSSKNGQFAEINEIENSSPIELSSISSSESLIQDKNEPEIEDGEIVDKNNPNLAQKDNNPALESIFKHDVDLRSVNKSKIPFETPLSSPFVQKEYFAVAYPIPIPESEYKKFTETGIMPPLFMYPQNPFYGQLLNPSGMPNFMNPFTMPGQLNTPNFSNFQIPHASSTVTSESCANNSISSEDKNAQIPPPTVELFDAPQSPDSTHGPESRVRSNSPEILIIKEVSKPVISPAKTPKSDKCSVDLLPSEWTLFCKDKSSLIETLSKNLGVKIRIEKDSYKIVISEGQTRDVALAKENIVKYLQSEAASIPFTPHFKPLEVESPRVNKSPTKDSRRSRKKEKYAAHNATLGRRTSGRGGGARGRGSPYTRDMGRNRPNNNNERSYEHNNRHGVREGSSYANFIRSCTRTNSSREPSNQGPNSYPSYSALHVWDNSSYPSSSSNSNSNYNSFSSDTYEGLGHPHNSNSTPDYRNYHHKQNSYRGNEKRDNRPKRYYED